MSFRTDDQELVAMTTLINPLATCLSHSGERSYRPLTDMFMVPVPALILRAAAEKLDRIRPRTLGTDGPPTEWPVIVFIDDLDHPFWAERRDGCDWWVSRANVPHPSKPTDRYLPVAALLSPQPETPP